MGEVVSFRSGPIYFPGKDPLHPCPLNTMLGGPKDRTGQDRTGQDRTVQKEEKNIFLA